MRTVLALIVGIGLLGACGSADAARVRPLAVGVSSDRTVLGVTSSYPTGLGCAKDPAGVELDIDGARAVVTARVTNDSGNDECTAECGTVYETIRVDEPLRTDVVFEADASADPGCRDAAAGPIEPEFPSFFEPGLLVVDLPCANRLMVASDDDHFELTVEWEGDYLESPDAQITERSVELPDRNWSARFEVGHDLSAQVPCSDVLAEDAAVGIVEADYEVRGRLEIQQLPAEPDGRAVATLHDASFELADDTNVELGTITLENPRFSFFAGG